MIEQWPCAGNPPALSTPDLVRCRECEALHRAAGATCPCCDVKGAGEAGKHLVDSLYRAYAVRLLGFVRSLGHSHGMSESLLDAEAVVHEAFAAMIGSLDTIENPPAWLFTVARRMVGKIGAAHQHRQSGLTSESLLDSSSVRWSSLTPHPDLDDVLEARRVMTDLRHLPHRQAVAVYLRHAQGWTPTEIGAYIDCAPATASVHIHRGTTRLREPASLASRLTGLGVSLLAICVACVVVRSAAEKDVSPPVCTAPHACPPPSTAPASISFEKLGELLAVLGHPAAFAGLAIVLIVCLTAVSVAVWHSEREWRTLRARQPAELRRRVTDNDIRDDPASREND
ncbi:RNA polymerase sigma factor [Amycolatopsis sp. CA-126428]|uniref:RNA polymerase sigma factor n=1 Tax=Amycolatopsis sp. CA-126428 TaxID=2073158 RepID=UPI0011B0BFD9|nr:RNA polymerase sigma factor [Amycolatopsis sp. CA-126428]